MKYPMFRRTKALALPIIFLGLFVLVAPFGVKASIFGSTTKRIACPAQVASKNLALTSKGTAVTDLQRFLNASSDTQVAESGSGSPGNETDYFGALTQKAVIKFQEKYKAEILTSAGLSKGSGYFGPNSRAKTEEICVAYATVLDPADLMSAAANGFKKSFYTTLKSYRTTGTAAPTSADASRQSSTPTPAPVPPPQPTPTPVAPVPPPPPAVVPVPDSTVPSTPANLSVQAPAQLQARLTWSASTDNVAVVGYQIYRCTGSNCTASLQIGTSTGASFLNTAGLAVSTSYRYRVRAFDAAGNFSKYSSHASVTTLSAPATPAPAPVPPPPPATPTADTTAPSTPTNLSLQATGQTTVMVSWSSATDNVAVTGYKVYRCTGSNCTASSQTGTSTTSSFSDAGLSTATSYRYRVSAFDAKGNVSSLSSHASVTTLSAPVTPTPPAPTPTPVPPPTPVPQVVGETRINTAYATFYTWFDNTPAGSSDIAFPKKDGYPTKHDKAAGTGTYADPITVAVGHVISGGKSTPDYAPGTMLYSPYIGKYGIVEDLCGDGGSPQNIPCHNVSTADAGSTVWFDWWLDGQNATNNTADNCAKALTRIHTTIINPASNYKVVPGAILSGSTCPASLGDTIVLAN